MTVRELIDELEGLMLEGKLQADSLVALRFYQPSLISNIDHLAWTGGGDGLMLVAQPESFLNEA